MAQPIGSPLMQGRGLKQNHVVQRYKETGSPLMQGRGLKPRQT